jgi:hypothetical protein
VKKEDAGRDLRCWFTDVDGDRQEITLLGVNPYTGKWVAACDDWLMKVSELEDDDWEVMEVVEDDPDDLLASGERAVDQILDERERTGL